MAFTHSSGAYFKLGDLDCSQYLASIDPTFERALATMKHLGKDSVETLKGHRMATFAAQGSFDPTFDAAIWAAWDGDAAVAWEYGPQGNGDGAVKYSGNCQVHRYKPGPAGGDSETGASFDTTSDGDISRGTFSA
jgi:hypothetical protein